MHDNIIVARGWVQDRDAAAVSASLECAGLFSLLGLAASVTVLLGSSAETVATITAALAM